MARLPGTGRVLRQARGLHRAGGQSAARAAAVAVFDHLPDVQLVRGLFQSAVVGDAIEAAQYAVHHAPENHPVLPHVRHLLAWFLVRAERHAEALEQFRKVDGHIGALPWTYEPDPVAAYAAYRAMAVAGAGAAQG